MSEPTIFHQTIFGPIKSRRLGVSLGVNLLPTDGKVCSFDCIYCECGYNRQGKGTALPTAEQAVVQLEEKLKEMSVAADPLDVITFAGNGEPTLHPAFPEIIDQTIRLRDRYYPSAKVSVLSNSTRLANEEVFNTLLRIDNNILKLDSAMQSTVNLMNSPTTAIDINKVIEQLTRFDGKLIIQTMFLKGEVDGTSIDNISSQEVEAWLTALAKIRPQKVMIYSINRPTPARQLTMVSVEELNTIADKVRTLGIETMVTQ